MNNHLLSQTIQNTDNSAGIVGHAYVNKKNYSRHVEKKVFYGCV
jgi:ABC-type phosphate transport system substrate-binding protein